MSNPSVAVSYDRPQRMALIVGIVGAILGLAGLFVFGVDQFFQAYLVAFAFWISVSLGSLAFLELHFLVGSRWGLAVRRIMEAGAASIWLMGVLFIPLLFGLPTLYPWARPATVSADPTLQSQSFYNNVAFFIVRAVIYFAVWIILAMVTNRLSARLAASRAATPAGDPAIRDRLQGLGAAALILYVLTMSFAAIDWIMSLQPFWNSTAFGLIIIVGQVLTALAFAVLALNLIPGLSLGGQWTYETTPIPYKDLGALLLTLVLGWAYLAYFQLLIIWAGNLPSEVQWYVDRITGGWGVVTVLVTVFQFAIPFIVLLSMRVRHNLRILAWLGGILFISFLVNIFWHIQPAFTPGQFSISILDVVLPVGMGGLWLAVFFYHLKRRPALSEAERAILVPPSEQIEVMDSKPAV